MSSTRSLIAAALVASVSPRAVQAQLPRHVQVDLLKTEIMGAHDSKSWAVLLTKAAEAKKLGAPAGEMAWFEGKAYFHLKKYAEAKTALEAAFKTLKQGSPQYKEALELYSKAGMAEKAAQQEARVKPAREARARLAASKVKAFRLAKLGEVSLPSEVSAANALIEAGDKLLKAGDPMRASAKFDEANRVFSRFNQVAEPVADGLRKVIGSLDALKAADRHVSSHSWETYLPPPRGSSGRAYVVTKIVEAASGYMVWFCEFELRRSSYDRSKSWRLSLKGQSSKFQIKDLAGCFADNWGFYTVSLRSPVFFEAEGPESEGLEPRSDQLRLTSNAFRDGERLIGDFCTAVAEYGAARKVYGQ